MRNSNLPQSIILALFLFVNTLSFSNNFNKSVTINKELSGLFAPIITSFSPTSGTAGTEVTITGTGFTNASTVYIGLTNIAIDFVNATELKITIPCGLASGDLVVDGISAGPFTSSYISPTLSTSLGNLSYCVGTSVPVINLAGTPSGTTFNWTNNNPSIGLITSQSNVTSIPTFTAVNSTLEPISSIITVTPTINGCLGDPKSYTITINPLPVVKPISNISVCAGENINQINLTASSPTTGTGISFFWDGTNNAAIGLSTASGSTSPIPTFTAANTTNSLLTSTFTVTPTYQTCVGTPINFTIDVAPQSVGGVLSGAATPICSGSTSGLLSLNGNKGAVLNWESSTSGGAPWTSIANTATTYESAGLTQTTYFRVAVQNSGCAVVYSNTILITVNSSPSITGNLPICIGSTTALIGSANAAPSNAWQSSNTGIASISNTGLVSGIYPGTTVITYTNSNGCSTTINFVVNGLPTLSITNPGPICPPNTINLTLSSVTAGSTPSLNYSYFTDLSATNSVTNPNIIATSGTYYIKGTDSNGCSNVKPVSTVVNSLPTITISGAENPICTNNSVTLTVSGANTYSWNSGLGSNASVNVTPLTTTTYSVNATDNNGCVGTATATVTVKPLPTVSAGIDRAVCLGQSITLSGSGTAGTNYTWNNAITNSVLFTPSVTTLYTVTGEGLNGCFNTDSVLVTVNALPTAPTLNAVHPNCSVDKGTVQFSGLPTSGWTINPGSYNGTGATYLLNNQIPSTYNFSVTDINLCTSLNSSITINTAPIIPAMPIVGTITQPSCTITSGSVVLSGLPSGNWTITKLPGGETYTNTGNTYTVTNLSSGTYTFSVSNGTCSSLSSSNVVIDAVPTQQAPTIGTITHPTCATATGSVTLNGLPTGNWTITRVSDGIQFSGSVGSTIISNLSSGTYYYTVTNASGCVSNNSNPIFINSQPVSPVAPVANAQSFLASANATINDLAIVSSGTPIWYANAVGGSAIPTTTLLATGTYYASQTTSNGCESIGRTAVSVSVFPTSVGGSVSGTTSVCSGSNSTILTLSSNTGSIQNWESSTVSDFSSNVQFINIQSTTYTASNLTAPLYFRAVVLSGTTSYSTPAFIDVVAQSIGGNLAGSTAICPGQNGGSLTVSGNIGTIIRWEQSIDNGSVWSTISNTTTSYNPGNLTVTTKYRVVVQNGVCPEVYSTVATITVKSTPTITDIPDQNVCYGNTVSFGNPVATAGYEYEWSSLLGISPNPSTPDYSFTVTQSDTYTYTITNNATGCSVSDSFTITMKPLPNATVISPTSICEGNSINIGANSVTGNSYLWTSNPIGIISSDLISNPSTTPTVNTTYTLEETVTASGCKASNSTLLISVQPKPILTIIGAPQYNVCETTTPIQIQSSAINYISTSVVWSKVIGSGDFDFINILNPKYSPSTADIALGSVKLRLTVTGIGPCAQTYSQDLEIIIDKKPIASAGLDVITCGTTPVQINATGTLYANSLLWSLPSGITGTLDQSNPYIPIFTPSASDVNYVGPIVISLVASSNTTCPSSPDTVTVLITPAPIVDAGPPTATICEDSNYIVPSNPMASQNTDSTTILWTKGTGDGTIVGPNSLTPTYIPGANDIANGSVTLTLSAAGNSPCSTPTTDNIILTIVKKPVVNVGPDNLVCEGPININATILNAGSILWTSNGNGNFIDATAISPIYNPALSDLNTTVSFTATVTPQNSCGPIVSGSVLYRINAAPIIIAGGDDTICQSETTYNLQATATNETSITWTTTGSGSFDNIHNEDPIYTLSPNDILAGSITFRITGTQSGCADDFDEMVLTIQKNPIANTGLAQIICQGDSVIIPGSATNSNTFSWIRNGGIGSFINNNTANPTYTSQISESGTIYLTLTAGAIAPCVVSANSDTTITIVPKATADAGSDGQICEGDTFHVTSASSTNNIGLQWTGGDGTFTGDTTIDPIYTPGPSDISNGSVVLTLIATKNFPCNANAVDKMTLTINKIPAITVINPDVDLCVGDPSYVINGVIPTNYDSLLWTTSGTGTFSPNNTSETPTYFPSSGDYTLGTVILTLTASRDPLNCNSSTSETITLHFIEKPTANAGPLVAEICQGFSYVTNGASATNYSNVTWSSTGSGTFTSETTLLATYTPSSLDYDAGFVELTLSANTIAPCTGIVTDVIRLDLQKIPVITVPSDTSICINQNSFPIGGVSITPATAYDVNSIKWTTTTSTGYFSPSGDALNPFYNPSVDDYANGFADLTITVDPIAPCITSVSKSFRLSFEKLPVASAGPNLTICDTPFHIITATTTAGTVNDFVWSTSGNGTFDYTNILDPIYTPSSFDVANSPITLTLTAKAIAPCTLPSITTLQLTIVKSPIITVTPIQLPICEDATNTTVLGTTVSNQSSYIWTSTTGTTISNNTALNPIVTPSAQDIINNQIILTITAQPVTPCTTPVSKTVTIPIQKKPIVSAGTSQTICAGANITTTDATATFVDIAGGNLQWTNNGGDGTFITTANNSVTTYEPGATEIANGSATLTLTGTASSPCTINSVSTLTYIITKKPTLIVSPAELTICENAKYKVQPGQLSITNLSSVATIAWSASSPGTLTTSGTLDLEPTFTPSAADIINNYSILTVTLTPIAPCSEIITGTIKVNISKQATINATQADYTFCENTPKQLTAVFANHDTTTILWRIVSGAGTLNSANSATPIFTPDASSTTVLIEVSVSSNLPCTAVTTKQFTLNVIKKPIVTFAKTTATICNTQTSFPLDGSTVDATLANATTNTTYKWTTTGTGNFANDTAITLPNNYNFSAADLLSNSVTLRLTAYTDPLCSTLSTYDEITINITKAPTVVTAPIGSVCQGSEFTATALATNNSAVLWSTVGTSNGLFANANQPVTQYTPGTNDINSFTIQVTAEGNAPCAAVSATKNVTIQQKPTIDAGIEKRYNCSGQTYQITGVTGQSLGAILWTSNSGAPGTFSDPTALNPSYTPSAPELISGKIILTVTAQAVAPCTDVVSDFIELNLTPNQVVNAGLNQTICEGSKVSLTGSATNASSVNWTSSGDGTFSVPNSLTPDYIPGTSDLINGTVTLTLHAIGFNKCPEVTYSTVITILKKPTANAGANVSICEGSSYTLSSGEASAQNYASISWSATGPGTLDSSTINSLTPTYNPAPGQTGIVTLTLTATGYSECNIDAVSSKTITIIAKPVVLISPPSSITICQGEPLSITNVDAQNYSTLTWTSSNGLGSFAPNNSKATTYNPLANQSGTVTLKLTATALNTVCTNAFSEVAVTIIPSPIVNAGLDASICETATHTISGASVPLGAIFNWTITGPATISSGIGTTEPVITPNSGASGAVTLTLTVQGTLQCPIDVSDSVTITVFPEPTVDTGSNQIACEGVAFIALSGTVTNGSSYAWSTNGSGSIQASIDPLQAKYTPGSSDYINPSGVTTITNYLTAIGANGCSNVVKSMTVTFYAKPKVNAGIDVTTCQGSSVSLENTIANNFSALTWSTSGDGTFDYSSSNGGKNPTYILGPNDLSSVTLTMHALPNINCSPIEVTDQMVITVQKNPTIIASKTEIIMCAETLTLPDLITVNNANSILWTNTTLVGDKSIIINPNSETPSITPTAAEIANGFALLTVTAEPLSKCSEIVSQVIKVRLTPKAIADAGSDKTFCQGTTIIVDNNADTNNSTDFYWTENGTGEIKGSTLNTLKPEYLPGINETGIITLTLHVKNVSPCLGEALDTMTVTINPQPIASAGANATICETSTYNLINASAANFSSLEWFAFKDLNGTTLANGTFSDEFSMNPTFIPDATDIISGKVYLTLRASSVSCGTLVSDTMELTIAPGTGVNAGSNASICEGSTFSLTQASAENTSSLLWTSSQNSSGTSSPSYVSGTFIVPTGLNPIYNPSPDDIIQGHVYLKLTGASNSTCPAISSSIRLDIIKKPTVSGNDIQMCINSPQVVLNGTASNYKSINWSIQSGPGSLITNSSSPLNPTFITGLPVNEPLSKTTIVRLYVEPKLGCPSSTAIYEDITINIQALPTVEAGLSGSTCYTNGTTIAPFQITGTNVTNGGTQNWTSSGPGTFTAGTPVLFNSFSNSCTSEVLTLTTNGTGACSASFSQDSVNLTINCSIPSSEIIISDAPTTICQGATAIYSIPVNSSVQSYTWSVPTGATIIFGQNTDLIQVQYSSTALSGNVSVTRTNGCGSVISTLPITINALPTGTTITGAQTVCAGDTNVAYTAAAIANATSYVWTLPNGSIISTGTNTITTSFGLTEVSGNLTVAGNNSCGLGVASVALPITIVPKPNFISSITPAAICSESIFNYTPDSSTIGATYNWTRAAQSGLLNGVSSGNGNIIETLINNSAVPIDVIYQYTVLGSAPTSCSNLATVTVRVNPIPSLTSATVLPAICSNGTFSYAPTSDSSGDINWSRAMVAGISQNAASGIITSTVTSISETLTNTTSSPITVIYKITLPVNSSGCANTIDLPVVVNPLPVATIAGTTTLCKNNASPIITFTGSNGIAPYTFTYTINGGTNQTVTTTAGNSALLNVPTTNAGSFDYNLISVQDSSSSACSQLQSGLATIIVNPTPSLVVNQPAPVCSPNTVNLTALTTGSDSGLSYTYWRDSLATVAYASPTLATAGIYYIKSTNSNGCFDIKSATVFVNPLPTASISGTSTVCKNNASPVVTFTAANGTAPYTFTYSINNGSSLTVTTPSGSSSALVLAPTTSVGVYNYKLISVQDASITSCSQAQTGSAIITVNSLPTATISSSTSACLNSANPNITFTGSNGIAPYTFTYSVDGGPNQIITSSANSAQLPVSTATTGIFIYNLISVSDSSLSTCSQAQSGSTTVTINPLPTLIVTNPAEVCVPNTVDIIGTTSGSSPGLTYSYWNDNATTIVLTNPGTVFKSGIYYIKGTDTNGCFNVKPVTARINPLPSATITGTNSFTVCQNATEPILTFTGSNGTPPYNFSYQIYDGLTITTKNTSTLATSNSVSVPIPTATVGNYTVTLVSVQDSSASSCSNSSITLPSQAFINIEQGGIIIPQNASTVSQTLCEQISINPIVFNIGGSATNSYATGLPAGLVQNYDPLTKTFTISSTAAATGTFNYTVHTSGSVNGCDTTYNGTLIIKADDSITLLTPTTDNQNICSGGTIQPITYSLGGGATGGKVTFSPSQPLGINWSIASNILTISGSSNTIGNFNYTVESFGICDNTTYSGTIKISENATVTLVSGDPNTTLCEGTSFTSPIQYSITPSTEVLVVSGLPAGVSLTATGLITGIPTQSGSFPYTITSSTTCGNVLTGTITVNPVQSISLLSGTTNQIVCINNAIDTITYTVTPGITGVVVTPAIPNGISASLNAISGIVTISGTPTVASSLPQSYTITTQGACGPGATATINFDIKPAAAINFTSSISSLNQAVCQNATIAPIRFTVAGGATGIDPLTLPTGLILSEASGVYTISGNPTANGTFTIPITTTGCVITENIIISNVNSAVSINLTSSIGTDNQTQCQTNFNSTIDPIKYLLVGATGVNVIGLPSGVVSVYNSGTGELILNGIPTESGVFNYSVTTLPCNIIKTGVLKIATPISITNEIITDVSCSSSNNGALSVNIIGGVSSAGLYAINWSGPNGFQQNLTTISGLEAGQYTISGKDAIGCPLPTKTYTVLAAQQIIISLDSKTNVTCTNSLGCANFYITGGSGIFGFTLQYLDPSSQVLTTIVPLNNNYYNICKLKAGLYYLTVEDSKNCKTEPYLFTIYDYSTLKINAISLDSTLCDDNAGKIRVTVSSLDDSLTFYYNSTLVTNVNLLGNSIYELSITNPTISAGVIKVVNSQNCSDTKTVSTSLIDPDLDFTSLNLQTNGNVSVNESVKFTNGLSPANIPAEYNYVVWDFGDNSPYKVFYNPADIVPNSSGESIATVFHEYAIDGLFPVTFTVYNSFGCTKSITKIVTVGKGAEIIVPTAFSPNQDGINDLFRPMLLGLKEVNMFIYDSFGNLVYEISSETDLLPTDWGWNGIEKTRNNPINGTYRYYIISKTIDDKTIEKAGQFILIK